LKSVNGVSLIKDLVIKAGLELPEHIIALIRNTIDEDIDDRERERLGILLENAQIAKDERRPICQDTGVVTVFLFLPEGAKLPLFFKEASNMAVEKAYREAGFRASTVSMPIGIRKNPGTNLPAFIKIIDAENDENVRLVVMPKGAGSENASFMKMYLPTVSEEELLRDLSSEIAKRVPFSCPPVIVGVSIGGTFDSAPLNAKLALFDAGRFSSDFGKELKEMINRTGIGAFGLGGKITALDVQVRFEPTHIASLPVAVSMSCHALRFAEAVFTLEEWQNISFSGF
jgi:fumarate hydratase subunit alpha